ncbi:MAG TPA: AMP-binding protein, partial [Terricaulis sp.]|nr:AMP-binding protein [Terricaulis sp.]
GKTYSFSQIARLADAVDAAARSLGFDGDAPIGVLLRNRPTLFAAAVATVWRGHCLITINPLLPAAPLRADILALAAPILIADEEDWNNTHLREAAAKTGALCLSLDADGLAVRPVEGLGGVRGGNHRVSAPGVAVEMLTSGTTGAPKRVQLQRRSLERSLWTGAKYEAGNSGELALKRSAALQWMPLVHVAGLFNALYSIYNGRRVLLMERFDLDRWRDLIVEHRPRFANIPPSYLRALLERGFAKEDFSSLMVLRTGAAPLDHDLALEFERRYGVPVIEAYGATEFAGGVAGWTLKDYKQFGAAKRKSVGRANEGVELRIVDRDSFAPLPAETIGLLEVRTKQMGEGKDWIRTTDLASIDAEGFLYIHG